MSRALRAHSRSSHRFWRCRSLGPRSTISGDRPMSASTADRRSAFTSGLKRGRRSLSSVGSTVAPLPSTNRSTSGLLVAPTCERLPAARRDFRSARSASSRRRRRYGLLPASTTTMTSSRPEVVLFGSRDRRRSKSSTARLWINTDWNSAARSSWKPGTDGTNFWWRRSVDSPTRYRALE